MPRSNTPVEPLPVRHNSPINVEGTDKEGPLARYGVLQRVTVMYGAAGIDKGQLRGSVLLPLCLLEYLQYENRSIFL